MDASAMWNQILTGLQDGDPAVTGAIAAIIIGLLTIVFLVFRSTRQSKRQGVLFLGICDAGKTLIYSQLLYKTFKQTYTSIKPNSGEYIIPEKNKKLRLIDLPGHERIRGQVLDQYKATARALVFVVDSGSLQKDIKEVAEFLYTVMSDRTVSNHSPPILILCNKQDLTLAKGAKVIRSQLEKEINTLRITRAAALQGVGDTANNNAFLGKRDKDFEFTDLRSFKIDFAECSALGEKSGGDGAQLDELLGWLNKVA